MPQNWRHPMQQQVEERPKKRKKQEKKLEFEAGKVFTPGEVKEEDFELDLESAKFRAQKGQGGDRRGSNLHPPLPPKMGAPCAPLYFSSFSRLGTVQVLLTAQPPPARA